MTTVLANAAEDKALLERLKAQYGYAFYCKSENKHDYYYVGHGYSQQNRGVCDGTGKLIIPCKYSDISLYEFDKSGYAEVTLNSMKGAVDKTGKLIIPCKFDDIRQYQLKDYNGFCEVKNDGKWGVADKSGNIIIPCKFDATDITQLTNTKYGIICPVKVDSKTGVADSAGNIIIPCKYDAIYLNHFNKIGYIQIELNNTFGVVDKSGNIIIPCICDKIYIQAKEGIIVYQTNNKFGIKDLAGNDLTEPIYDNIEPFADGVAQVTLNGVTSLMTNPLNGTNLEVANSLTANVAVDKNIPVSKNKSTETFAFIVANEEYAKWDASYALNDGKVFRDYCEKRMGIPATNIKLYENATYGTFRSMMGKMRDIADVYDGDARIILYFAGLGTQADNEQFLLPVDASLANIKATGVSMRQLLDELSAMNTGGTVIITDAAFNGRDRRGETLGEHRGVAIKTTQQQPKGNVAWLTASSDARNALASENLNHGIFTYYLLDALQKSDAITFDSLAKLITNDVKKHTLKSDETQIPYTVKSDTFNNFNF